MVLGLFLTGCQTTPVIDPISSVDKNYFINKYFKGKKLSNIEGIWRWMTDGYEIAIIKNDTGTDLDFEYLGDSNKICPRGNCSWKRENKIK